MLDRRKFNVEFNVSATLTVSNEVIDRVLNNEDGWKEMFYDLDFHELIEMLVYNMLKGRHVSDMDGFADLSYDCADLSQVDYTLEYVEEVMEGTRCGDN